MHLVVSRSLRFLTLLQFAWLVSACGSGGGGGDALPVLPPAPVVPDFSVQPTSVSVVAGESATFTAAASGSPSFQWLRGGAPIAGATQATYTLAAANLADDGSQYAVIASNLAGSRTSQAARLSVTTVPLAPSFVRGPNSVSVVTGSTATFDVEMAGSSPFAFQWFKDGAAITGANQPSYGLSATLADNNAQISVQVTNAAGTVSSNPVPLRVSAQFVPVSISAQPADVTARAGDTVAFSASVEGTAPFAVRWLRNGAETELGGTGVFLNNFRFMLTPVQLSDDGAQISLRVTDSQGNTVVTRVARLTVGP